MSYRYTPEEIGMLNQEIDSLRARLAELVAENAQHLAEIGRLMA